MTHSIRMFLCVLFLGVVVAQDDCDSSVLCDGPELLQFTYPGEVGQIDCNEELTPEEVYPPPLVVWKGGEEVGALKITCIHFNCMSIFRTTSSFKV